MPNYGEGLISYVTADMGTDEIESDNVPQAIEDLVKFPLGQLLYVRPTWREVRPRPGRLEMPDYLELVFDLAKKNNKRVGLRVQMSAPDYTHAAALPDFVLEKVPKVDLVMNPKESSAAAERYLRNPHARYQPRFNAQAAKPEDVAQQRILRQRPGGLGAAKAGGTSADNGNS